MNVGHVPVTAYHDFTQLDSRGLGGKTMIMHHMKNHYDGLINTKPQLKIQAPKKYIYEDKHKHKKKQLLDPNAEVKVAFRKIASTNKGYIDTSAPVSANMTKQLAGRFLKEKKHETYEHQLNLQSMNKKLQSKKKLMKDRLKDPHDPIAHPVRFFRKNEELPKQMIDYLYDVPAGSRVVLTHTDAVLKERLENGPQRRKSQDFLLEEAKATNSKTNKNMRPGSAAVKQPAEHEPKSLLATVLNKGSCKVILGKPIPAQTPFLIDEPLEVVEAYKSLAAVDLLKKRLLDIIVKYSFYKDSQLQILFHEFKKANKRCDEGLIQKSIDSVLLIMNE